MIFCFIMSCVNQLKRHLINHRGNRQRLLTVILSNLILGILIANSCTCILLSMFDFITQVKNIYMFIVVLTCIRMSFSCSNRFHFHSLQLFNLINEHAYSMQKPSLVIKTNSNSYEYGFNDVQIFICMWIIHYSSVVI